MLASALLVATLAAAPARPVLTVLYFDNKTGEAHLEVLRKGLADMIITDLVAWDGVEVVERDKLEAIVSELKLQHTASFDPATAVKVGRFLGAQYLLAGTLSSATPELRIDARLIKADTAQAVASASVRGPADKVFDLEQELVDKITAGIDLKVKSLAGRRRAKVPDLESLVAYSVALDLTDQGRLEEAGKAIAALVSSKPSFLMARERKEEILKKLKEYEKRRADMATESVLELGRRADAALKSPASFDSLDEAGRRARLGWRVVKGRVMARVLKQYLSWRRESLRIPLKGKEAQALLVMRGWVENQRALVAEQAAHLRLGGMSVSVDLGFENANLLRDGLLGRVDPGFAFNDLLDFVVDGRLHDSDTWYRVAPTFGDLEPQEREAMLGELDARVEAALADFLKAGEADKAAAERTASDLLLRKAEALRTLGKTDAAIAEYQRVLDAFPTGWASPQAERHIKELIGAEHEDATEKRERWAKALKEGCADDMDVRVGTGTVLGDRLRHQGLAALAAHAAELEKACRRTPRNHEAIAGVYRDLAMESAYHEDCEGYRSWFTRYVEAGGSEGDMAGYAKNWTPWCELGDVVGRVKWLSGTLPGGAPFRFDRHLVSILAYDGKRLTINAGKEEAPESFSLYLDADGQGRFTVCHLAQWQRPEQAALEGRCTVSLTRLAEQRFEYDEGTFTATFEAKDGAKALEVRDGKFRVRRE